MSDEQEAWQVVADAQEALSKAGFPSCVDNGSSGGQPITLDEQVAAAVQKIDELQKQVGRQAELLRQKVKEFRFAPITTQRFLDCGLNGFAFQLVAESLGKALKTSGHKEGFADDEKEFFFEYEHKHPDHGHVRLNIRAELLP